MMDIDQLEELFTDDESELKKMLLDMGVDLDDLEKEFANYHPRKPLKYEVISDDAVEPSYNYPSDSGFDLYSTEEVTLEPFGRALIPTGLKFDIPDGSEIQVRPKSGLALKQGLTVLNTPGTVDSGYNGEIQVIVFNTNPKPFTIEKGMKIAQAVLCPVVNGNWVELIKVDSVDEKDRGDNGFGSTGINL
jgi:dUTP pyrophosphatase